jgi:hypothetical protein
LVEAFLLVFHSPPKTRSAIGVVMHNLIHNALYTLDKEEITALTMLAYVLPDGAIRCRYCPTITVEIHPKRQHDEEAAQQREER